MDRKEVLEHLYRKRIDIGVGEKVYCSETECKKFTAIINDEKDLPEDVYMEEAVNYDNVKSYRFYRYETGYREEEIKEIFELSMLQELQKIRSHTGFFVFLTVVGLILSLISMCVTCSGF